MGYSPHLFSVTFGGAQTEGLPRQGLRTQNETNKKEIADLGKKVLMTNVFSCQSEFGKEGMM